MFIAPVLATVAILEVVLLILGDVITLLGVPETAAIVLALVMPVMLGIGVLLSTVTRGRQTSGVPA